MIQLETDHRKTIVEFLRSGMKATGMADEIVPPCQVLLLGGNPLPILVAATVLAPKNLILVATEQTSDFVKPLVEQIKTAVPGVTIRTVELTRPHDASDLQSKLDQVLFDLKLGDKPVGLHYTGGTKTMAVNARMWWEARKVRKERYHCTYLDGESDSLVFEACPTSLLLSKVEVALANIIKLHRIEPADQAPQMPPYFDQLLDDLVAVAKGNASDELARLLPKTAILPQLKQNLNQLLADDPPPSEAIQRKVEELDGLLTSMPAQNPSWRITKGLADLLPSLNLTVGADYQALRRPLPEKYRKEPLVFLKDTWFEALLARELERCGAQDIQHSRTFCLPRSGSSKDTFEVDVLARLGHRPLVMSISTNKKRKELKTKLLEVKQRAEQLGGSLAIVGCAWFHESSSNTDSLRSLWEELAFGWSSPLPVRVLGLPHLWGERAFTHCEKRGGGYGPVIQSLAELVADLKR
ncbi:MAG TPA: hypothetical protein PKO07_21585 [Pseudomonadota bacterium]|nr:hypothetical protein [Pseudomonadota bacterium]